jgi:hypothetical protein
LNKKDKYADEATEIKEMKSDSIVFDGRNSNDIEKFLSQFGFKLTKNANGKISTKINGKDVTIFKDDEVVIDNKKIQINPPSYVARRRQSEETTEIKERKFDLGAGHLGNGITVWNRAKEVGGDYEKIAHIASNRKITWYLKNPPKEVIDYVEKIAKGKNPSVSTTQKDQKVFDEAIGPEEKIKKIRDIVKQKQYSKVDGVTVDLTTASLIIQIYDALNDVNKNKFSSLPIKRMIDTAYKLTK